MAKSPSKTKIKNFRRKMKDIGDEELELRAQLKALYAQLVLDVGDSKMALRHARVAFFQVQKYRLQQQMMECLEFHPFFGAHPDSSVFADDDDDDEDNIL